MSTKKFNPKLYKGKSRVYHLVSGHRNLHRVFIWDKVKGSYQEPLNGKRYLARRYEKNSNGGHSRVNRYFKTLQEAVLWQSFREEVEAEKRLSDSKGYRFKDLVKDFQKHRFPILGHSTRVNYKHAQKLLSFFDNFEVEHISSKVIDDWFSWLKEPQRLASYKKSRCCFSKELSILKAYLKWHIGRNDETQLMLPFKERHKEMMLLKPKRVAKPSYMTPEETEHWFRSLRAVSPNFYEAGVIQVEQVLRVSEVFGMTWDNYDERNGIYRFTHHVIYSRQKNVKPFLQDVPAKNDSGDYFISHLRDRSVEALNVLRRHARCNLIFHCRGNLYTYRQIQYGYNKAFKEAHLPYRSTHVCRHTGATAFLDETGDPLALQQHGNWATQKQAMHYGQIMKDRARFAIEKADAKRRLKLVNGGQSGVG